MTRYFIEEAVYGIGEGGMACGPVAGPVLGEVKVRAEEETFYLTLAEVDGLPHLYKTEDGLYKYLSDDNDEEETEMDFDELVDYMNDHFLDEISGEYEEVFKLTDHEYYGLLRLLACLVRLDWDESEELQKAAEGKWLDEIALPRTDLDDEDE